jgi:hypothetical protein
MSDVLRPIITQSRQTINDTLHNAYGSLNYDTFPLARRDHNSQFKPQVLSVLDNNPTLYDRLEKSLQRLGFRTEMLEYMDCGEEALVFAFKNVPDVILKVSVHKEIPPSPFILQPHYRYELHATEQDKHPTLSVAFLPRITGEYHAREEVGLKPEEITEHRNYRSNLLGWLSETRPSRPKPTVPSFTPKMNFQKLEKALQLEGLKFSDKKPLNVRYSPAFPDFPFVTDKRAVDPIEENNPKDAEHEMLVKAYTQTQNEIRQRYGIGISACKKILAQAKQNTVEV